MQRFSGLWALLARHLARLRRPAVLVMRVALGLALCVGAVGLGRLVEQHVRKSPAFDTKLIALYGQAQLDRAEVLQAAELEEGQNVFQVSPEDAESNLRKNPWIAAAEVQRRLPDSYEIRLREHRAVAVLALEGRPLSGSEPSTRLYLVADDGAVFKELAEGDPVDLPVITGVDRERFAADRALRTSLLMNAVALLHDYREAGLWRREPIGEIHVEANRGLSLYVGHEPTHVRLGKRPYRRKLRRLRGVLDRLRRTERRAAYVYLDNVRRPDRVTVRLKP